VLDLAAPVDESEPEEPEEPEEPDAVADENDEPTVS
jgi:hypothetical protein